jgi:hypothetical protein
MEAVPSFHMREPPIGDNTPGTDGPRMDRLRELRAEAQDLHSVLEKVRKGETTIKLNADYIRKTQEDLAKLVSQIQDGDTIRHLLNVYEQMIQNPLFADPGIELGAQEQLHALSLLEEQIRKIEFHVGILTIPARLNEWLAQARPGYYIPFNAVFEDEVPEAEDRARILSYLVWSPKPIKGGIVDAANGLIYRYSENPWARLMNIMLIAGALSAFTAIIVGACYLRVPGWPIQPQYLSSQGSLPPIASLGELPLILDARSGQIILKLLLALIGFFGLAFSSGLENVTPLNSFLVGYSLDSVVEIFGTGIEQRVASQAAALKKQLGVTSD